MYIITIILQSLQDVNNPTILSEWRWVAFIEEFFDILTDIHCKEKGHIGSKKTLAELRSAVSITIHCILTSLYQCSFRYQGCMNVFLGLPWTNLWNSAAYVTQTSHKQPEPLSSQLCPLVSRLMDRYDCILTVYYGFMSINYCLCWLCRLI